MKKNTENKKAASRNAARRPSVSPTVKPMGMTAVSWQKSLRKEIARRETYSITELDQKHLPGYFSVSNYSTRSKYKVVYRGRDSKWNFCSCMDFKTNGLGTCKHIEAVKDWAAEHRKYYKDELPPFTSVYLDYTAGRKVRIRVGSDDSASFNDLASKYFDDDFVLRQTFFSKIDSIIKEALDINDTFRCYDDAYEFVTSQNDAARRKEMIESLSDSDLDNLLHGKLYPYQKKGIRFAFEKGRAIIADEMGLGKTIQAIGTAELLKKMKLVGSVLVVCPTSLKYQWKSEIEKFTGSEAVVVEGCQQIRLKMYESDAFYKIVSYNAMSNDVKLRGKLRSDLLIMDEVQRLKNWNTQISRAARKIVSDYSVILSGTPLENKLEELYSVMQFVDQFCLGPLYEFREQTTVTNENGKIVAYKNLNAIGEKIKTVMMRRRKADVALQLPSRTDTNIFVSMTDEQESQHQEFASAVVKIVNKWNHYHFLSETDRRRLLLLLSQMRMVCDSTFILDQTSRNDVKIGEVMNIISNIVDSGDRKIVVFSGWERMTRLVAGELDSAGIAYSYLHGGVPSHERSHLVSDFTEKPECRVFLSTDAGSTGLNLQVASIIVNLDLPWNPAVLEQRVARIYRIGQQNPIQVFNLISKMRKGVSIEERMIGTLGVKSALAQGILDNGLDAVSIDDNKLKQLMDTLQPVVEESADIVSYGGQDDVNYSYEGDDQEEVAKELEKEGSQNETEEDILQMEGHDVLKDTPPQQDGRTLINQGLSFLSGLAKALQTPESTRALVDSLVKTDEKTGETSINIPVRSKSEITDILNLVGKFLPK